MTNLLNAKLWNDSLWNGGGTLAVAESADSVSFERISLNDGVNIILEDPPLKGPSREIIGGNIPRDDGQYVTGSYFRETGILLRGHLKAASKEAMATLMDYYRKLLTTQEGNLDIIEDDGTVKRFIATCVNFDDMFADKKRYHLNIVPFTMKFLCKTPHAKARAYTSDFLTITTSPTNQSIVNMGTYRAKPVFIFIFTAATAVTAVQVKNTTTGEYITFTGSLAAGDVLRFDSERSVVEKNGAAQSYSGTFPRISTGTNVMQHTVTASAFTTDITSKFKPTFVA